MIKSNFPAIKLYTPDEIRAIRKGLKNTRKQFARRFLVSAETVKAWETGRRNPYGPSIVILCQLEQVVDESAEVRRTALDRYRGKNKRVNP